MAVLFALVLTVHSPNASAITPISSISIEKTGPDTALMGETITYDFTIYNDGEVDLYIDYLNDDLLGDLSSYLSDDFVEVGGYETFQVDYVVAHSELDPLMNTVNVEATDEFGENFAEDWDDHSVDILRPGITIEKSGPPEAMLGQSIYYEITVTNTGETDLYIDFIYDTLLGDLASQITDGIITTSEGYESFSVEYQVLESDGDPLTNEIDVQAFNEYWTDSVYDVDFCDTNLLHTGVSIEKTGPSSAVIGETITYDFTVTNIGEVDLHITYVFDDLLGTITSYLSDDMITTSDGFDTFSVNYVVDGTYDPLYNTVMVGAENEYGYDYKEDMYGHQLDVLHTGVMIEKTGPSEAMVGDEVMYTITVTNTGDADLYIMNIDDSLLGSLYGYISGGVITVAEHSETIYVYRTVLETDPNPLVNHVELNATNEFGDEGVWAEDDHSMIITEGPSCGSICVFKYEDMNGNGVQDEGEPGLADWEIRLMDVAGAPIATNTTDCDGYACFWDLAPGTYYIDETLKTGWYRTENTSAVEVIVTSGDAKEVIFGNTEYVTVEIFKYEDLDGDLSTTGDRVPADVSVDLAYEEAPSQWTMIFYGNIGSDGYAEFTGLKAGYYDAVEFLDYGWYNLSNTNAHGTALSGDTLTLTFVNTQYVTVEIYKWEDMDGNLGTTDDRVPANVSCDVWYEWGTPDQALIWNGYIGTDGYIELTGLKPGFYDSFDGIGAGWYAVGGDNYESGTVASGDTLTFTFVNTRYVTVEIFKWEDLDGDITTTDDWVPVDVSVDLFGPGISWGGKIGSDGYINFTDLEPGFYDSYEYPDTGWYSLDGGYESGTAYSGETLTFIFVNAQSIVETGSICVFKYEDMNGNGVQDAGDLGLEGWDIKLLDSAGAPIATNTTDCDGYACFWDLAPGTYYVDETLKTGGYRTENASAVEVVITSGEAVDVIFGNTEYSEICIFKYEDMNGNGVYDADDVPIEGWHVYFEHGSYAVPSVDGYTNETGWFCTENVIPGTYWVGEYYDSDWMGIENGSGNSIEVTVVSGSSVEVWFGNAELISICGYKLEDININGEFELGTDPGIDGWSIKLWYHDGMSWDVWGYIETDEDGYFCFERLNPFWDYVIEEELKDGWTAANPYYHYLYPAGSGDHITGIEFLNAKNISICGYKLEDIGLDGWGCDGPVEGWQVDLYGYVDSDHLVNDDWEVHHTTTTDATGKYCFEDLDPYLYYSVSEEMRADWSPSPVSPILYAGLAPNGSGENITGVNFLNVRNINLGGPGLFGYKLEDVDLDGDGDVGVAGWQIYLYGFENQTAWEENDWSLHLTTTTGADGSYFFANLNPYWIYDVYEETRSDWTPAGPTEALGLMAEASGENIPGVNFTNARNIDICGCKWEDKDLSGDISCGDETVAGWEVTLKIWDGDSYEFLACTTTGPCGCYCFENLDPYEMYAVYEELRDSWTEVVFEHEGLMACGSGVDICGVDFLNARNGEICGHKYWDKNANGIYEPCTETPLQGWTIKLYAWVGEEWVYQGQELTDCDGVYCFENLNPYLTYKVAEVIPDGWWPISPDDGDICPITFCTSGQCICDQDFFNIQCGPEGKTIGFWKTNVGKNLGYIKGKPQISAAQFNTYLGNIYTRYFVNLGYDFEFLNYSGLTQTQKLQKAWNTLNVDDSSEMRLKAEAHILALLLTEQWTGSDYSDSPVYVPACITGNGAFLGTMSEVIQEILGLYGSGEYEQAKNMADFLNNLPDSCEWCSMTETAIAPSIKPKK